MRIAAFTATGERIVATADWVPANARIVPDSWRIEPDGRLAMDFDGLDPCWDGVLTATDEGYAVYLTAGGAETAEPALSVFALDAEGAPCGEPLAFAARRAAAVFDPALATRAAALATAAQAVLDARDGGDLAAAMRGLARRLTDLRPLLPTPQPQRPCAASPADHGDTP